MRAPADDQRRMISPHKTPSRVRRIWRRSPRTQIWYATPCEKAGFPRACTWEGQWQRRALRLDEKRGHLHVHNVLIPGISRTATTRIHLSPRPYRSRGSSATLMGTGMSCYTIWFSASCSELMCSVGGTSKSAATTGSHCTKTTTFSAYSPHMSTRTSRLVGG